MAKMAKKRRVSQKAKKGADRNVLKNSDFTLLHMAAHDGDEKLVLSLIADGVNPDVRGRKGYAPLHITALNGKGKAEMAKTLIAAGADPNVQNDDGNTPLHLAAVNGLTELAKALVDAGANPEARNDKRTTPIEIALHENRETAKVLMDARPILQLSPPLAKLFYLLKRAFAAAKEARDERRSGG